MFKPLFKKKSANGFTLFEVIVAVAIFSVVMLMAVSIFSRFTQLQRQDIGQQQLQEDMRLALDIMNREIQTAYGNTLETNSGNTKLWFRNERKVCVRYDLEDGGERRLRRAQYYDGSDSSSSCASYEGQLDGAAQPVSDSSTVFDSIKFYPVSSVFNPSGGDSGRQLLSKQGVVTYTVEAHSNGHTGSSVAFQSSTATRQVNKL